MRKNLFPELSKDSDSAHSGCASTVSPGYGHHACMPRYDTFSVRTHISAGCKAAFQPIGLPGVDLKALLAETYLKEHVACGLALVKFYPRYKSVTGSWDTMHSPKTCDPGQAPFVLKRQPNVLRTQFSPQA